MNPVCFDVDNQDDDVDIPSYNGSANSVNDLRSIGSFTHIGFGVDTKGRRPNGLGLSDVVGREMKIPRPS